MPIEIIRTFYTSVRGDGTARLSEGRALRCTKCGEIFLTKKEFKEHDCKPAHK